MPEPIKLKSPPSATVGPNDPSRRLASLWSQGQQPRVEDFLAQTGIRDPAVVTAVLRVDQWERGRVGQWIPAESYLDAFPAVRNDPEQAIDLVFAEYMLREQRGESPTLEEYARRFPQYADQLKLQVELHEALGADEERRLPATWSEERANRSANRRTQSQAGSDLESHPQPEIPGYEVLGVLGWGGMGVVYRVWQKRVNRIVALKMVHAGAQASPQVLARFSVEAEAVARLHHPNIVQIYDLGQHAGSPFLVLELIEGPSLAQALAGTPQPARRAAELVESLARAIHSAHRQGVVHRDLTPANILLTADGSPKITDFGLAKIIIGGGELRTGTGELLGTPSYMAPEQAASRHETIGVATDVYALGAILYDMLTGRPPFKAESPLETLRQVASDEPVPPSRLRPRLPRDLETTCLKCLRKEPAQRYASAEALGDDLRRFLQGRPILARRSGAPERAWRWCRRNRAVASLLACVAALLVGIAIAASISATRLKVQRDRAHQNLQRALMAERDALARLGDSYLAQAEAGRFSARVGQRFASLDALSAAVAIARSLHLPAARLTKLRNQAIACLALPDLQRIKQWDGWIAGTVRVAYDADFARYARLSRDGRISVRRTDDDQELLNLEGSGFLPRFTRDGKYLAVEGLGKYLEVWSLERKMKVATYHDQLAWDFSPEGRLLAIGHDDGSLVLHDLTTGRPARTWTGAGLALKVSCGPGGRKLAMITRDPRLLQIRDATSGNVVAQIAVPEAEDLAWHPDGTTVAISGNKNKLSLWDVTTHSRKMDLEGRVGVGVELAFSPAGDTLASWGWDGKIRLWDPRTGKLILSMAGFCHHPAFHRAGRLLAAHDENSQMGLWRMASRREYRTLLRDAYHERYWEISVHPGGRLLAVGMESGVGLWDLTSGLELGFLPIGRTRHLLFDSSGNLLTRGPNGVWRWPVRDVQPTGTVRIGPPRALPLPASDTALALSKDGRVLVLANVDGAFAVKTDHPGRWIRLGPQDDVRYIAVSPDGRWVATGSHHNRGVKIWRARDGELAIELPSAAWSEVAFDSAGRWLALGHTQCRVWSVGSWTEGRTIGGAVLGFSPDGRFLAVETGNGVVRLVDPATGQDFARLEDPNQERANHIGFSPDGARLVVASGDSSAIHVWDLRAIRRDLATMDLDWDTPHYPEVDPADPALPALPPLQVELGPFPLAGPLAQARFYESVIADLEAALACDTEAPGARLSLAQNCNNYAWKLANGTVLIRDLNRALSLARRALELRPRQAMYLNTLGVVQFRLGRFAEALPTLEQSLTAGRGQSDAYDLFFMAMAHHRLGHRKEARGCFDRAVHWLDEQKSLPEQYATELASFRAETETLLAGPALELPANVLEAPP
jgi:WD40 repeat protein